MLFVPQPECRASADRDRWHKATDIPGPRSRVPSPSTVCGCRARPCSSPLFDRNRQYYANGGVTALPEVGCKQANGPANPRKTAETGFRGALLYNANLGPLAQLVRAEDSSENGVGRGEPRHENRVNSGKPTAAHRHGNPEPSRGYISGRCRDSAEG